MSQDRSSNRSAQAAHVLLPIATGTLLVPLSGCLVAGWSSQGGGFLWPGGALGVLVVLALLYFLLRGR